MSYFGYLFEFFQKIYNGFQVNLQHFNEMGIYFFHFWKSNMPENVKFEERMLKFDIYFMHEKLYILLGLDQHKTSFKIFWVVKRLFFFVKRFFSLQKDFKWFSADLDELKKLLPDACFVELSGVILAVQNR